MRRLAPLAALLAIVLCLAPAAQAAGSAPSGLTVGDRTHPLNVHGAPQFGWLPQSRHGNAVQTAYELEVERGRKLVWDSGKVRSSQQSYVEYEGPALAPGTSYEWRVRTWDRNGHASRWAHARFDTGLEDDDWSGAQWIRRVTTGNDFTDDYTLARRQVSVGASRVTRARAYVSALGQYELSVNGDAVYRGDSFGYPGEGQNSATDITDEVRAGRPLALGVLYHYWTCTCQGRANGRVSNTTVASAATAGDTNLKVASVLPFDAGDPTTVGACAEAETATVTAVGTAGAAGTGLTLDRPLARAHGTGNAGPVYDHNGPSGLLVKVVVDHADGSRDTIVSDGSWKVTKATQYTNATVTSRNGDAGDRLERYDARLELPGWDRAGFDTSGWQAPAVIGPHPRPQEELRDTFSHLDPVVSDIEFKTVHPKSVRRLADGTLVADFGVVLPAAPRIRLRDGVDGRALSMLTSFRLNNTTLAAPAAAGDSSITVGTVSSFAPGDRITVDAPANGRGAGDPEVRTIVAADGTVITLDAPLARDHAANAWVEGSRAGRSGLDSQGSNLGWFYTEKPGPQTAQAFTHWGWRYLQIDNPGEPLTKHDIAAVVQHSEVSDRRKARFDSDDETLDDVFDLMQRSGLYSSQETFVDTPTREKGQFLGDTIDISFANMSSWGERNATARAIREFVYSGAHRWKAPSNNYCTAAQVPCSFASLGTPGRLGAVYPNGDNMRDIPDYTETFPDWVMRYWDQTGDTATLASAYDTMRSVAEYIRRAQPAAGGTAGLVTDLPGGAGPYRFGIIDWPAPMRYGYTFDGNTARTIHNAEAVGAYRATARSAAALGRTEDAARYDGWADELTAAINEKLRLPSGLYSDGLSATEGNPQIPNSAQHAQTFPIYYGVAPEAARDALADHIAGQGMRQGPMTWHKLLSALAMAGRDDQIVELLTDAGSDGPAKILAQGGTFMWEQWDPGCAAAPCSNPSESSSESFSHGWGAWGVVDMIESLLGVSVTSPGAATVRIEPPTIDGDDLGRVSGSAWTQRGTVRVSWKRTRDGTALDVDVPVNVRATVAIPVVGASTRYKAGGDGAPVFKGVKDGHAVFAVGSGGTRFRPAR
jgi:Bacterial alpha-L-rhamnosidase 6 hairpin glycosidase domain/Alpha-L-rhamnosidase N-terminal domain/Bacterial alpha-L-rhamnosidase C-terminal domain